jgi:arylsulfatase A-like enzyme
MQPLKRKATTLLACIVCAFLCSRALGETSSPNFLIIVTDDQGYGDLGAFKHHAPDVRTPNMDRIAAKGVLFTDAYASAPVCSPSRAGWNTGQHQVRWDPKSSFGCGLPNAVTHIAEIMKANGYATARIGKNDNGKGLNRRGVREDPMNHGFDEFLGFSAHGHDFFLLSKDIETRTPDPKGHSAVVGPLMHNKGVKEFKNGYLTEVFTNAAINFVERDRDTPFFLTLSYNSVHHLIHQSPKRYLEKYGVKAIPKYDPDMGSYARWFKQYITLGRITEDEMRRYYLANLNCLDDNIGRVLDALEERSLADNTVVIIFSDNGDAPTNGAWNRPLAGAKFSLWEGGIRVPFILSRPSDPHAGETWNHPISTLDVLPTCLEAAGIKLPETLDGRPIPKSSKEFEESRHLFWRWGGASYAVRSGDWKLLHNGTVSNRKPTAGIVNRKNLVKGTRLFNLREDISESRDLAEDHPEVVQRLQNSYADWSEEVAAGKRDAK